ncbi:dTMP kinase [Phycisphaerales bacterium AB-hyl4]|uniref:Thymidylate kinase n=1 Tax=Natronomicrosphaera hydrolytica TaxID=3242702 RepID=A0ABV4U2M9_9BACT
MTDPNASWLPALRGRFVVFDGPDGSGKSTQFRRFTDYVEAAGIQVCHVREPGGTAVGEHIRKLLLEYRDDQHGQMDLHCEMLLFMASRAQLVRERIAPARQRGELVLADRFISSTLAYQGTAGGMAIDAIRQVGHVALGEHWPDLVVIFDVDEKTAASRLSPLLDRMEQKGSDYHRKVRQGYLDQAQADPSHHLVIDARAEPDIVFDRLTTGLRERAAAW